MSNTRKPAVKFRTMTDRVVIANVRSTEVSTFYHDSLTALLLVDALGKRRIIDYIREVSSANISDARNRLVRRFLATDGDWLLFLDSDMVFEPDLLDGLLANASPDKAPIVGALCFGVADGVLFPTIYQLAQFEGKPVATRHQGPIPEDTMLQVASTGAAALLIHRSVLERIAAAEFNATFPWFQETEMAGRPCGEDFTFCLRAMQLGIPVYVYTAVEVGHHKSHVLRWDDYKAQEAPADA